MGLFGLTVVGLTFCEFEGWVGLDSATNLEYVERPPDSAERGIGAHCSRIQRALGGLHRATRPIGVDLHS